MRFVSLQTPKGQFVNFLMQAVGKAISDVSESAVNDLLVSLISTMRSVSGRSIGSARCGPVGRGGQGDQVASRAPWRWAHIRSSFAQQAVTRN